MTDLRRVSYTAASSLPLKLLHSQEAMAGVKLGRVFPVHVQFTPTDRCNLKCSWCSCANDSRKVSIKLDRVKTMVDILKRWSTKAITVTGGGEPLLHSDLPSMLRMFDCAGWEIGLVTNAYLFDKLPTEALCRLRWCRISCSDDRGLETKDLGDIVEGAVNRGPMVDWAFSYVVTKEFNVNRLAQYLEFADENGFTHVRVVSDLLDLDNVPDMDIVKAAIKECGVDDRLAIYQGRKDFTRGVKNCWISLLKPVISADGKVFPCCGAQYSLETPTLNMPPELCMGEIEDLDEIMSKQQKLDGSICYRCYYDNYNTILDSLLSPVNHGVFV